GAEEGEGGAVRERFEDVAHACERDDVARRPAEDAIDLQIFVRRRQRAERLALREIGRDRSAEALFAAVAVHDGAREREEAPLLSEAIDDLRWLLLGRGALVL